MDDTESIKGLAWRRAVTVGRFVIGILLLYGIFAIALFVVDALSRRPAPQDDGLPGRYSSGQP